MNCLSWPGDGESVLIDCNDRVYVRNAGLEIPFNPGLEGHRAGGASHAGPVKANHHVALFIHIDQFQIASVGLDGGSDHVQHLLNFLMKRSAAQNRVF